MKYTNAAEILPERLLKELQAYIEGDVIYVPRASARKQWGTKSGSRLFYQNRNEEIRRLYREGKSIDDLSKKYGLAYGTVRKILYG